MVTIGNAKVLVVMGNLGALKSDLSKLLSMVTNWFQYILC